MLTQRSNLTVGPPFELVIIPAGSHSISHQLRLEADDPYLDSLIAIWSDCHREALYRVPRFPWEQEGASGGTGAAQAD